MIRRNDVCPRLANFVGRSAESFFLVSGVEDFMSGGDGGLNGMTTEHAQSADDCYPHDRYDLKAACLGDGSSASGHTRMGDSDNLRTNDVAS